MVLEVGEGRFKVRQQAAGRFGKEFALPSEGDVAGVSLEQARPEGLLQAPDHAAEGRLGDMAAFGSAGEVAALCQGQKGLDQAGETLSVIY